MPIVLAGVAVGLLALLLLYILVSPAFREAVRVTVGGIPLIGGWLASNMAALNLLLFNAIAARLADSVRAVGSTINYLTATLDEHWGQQARALEATSNAIWRVRYQTLPALARQLEAYAAARALAASTYALALAKMGVRYTQTAYSSAVVYSRAVGLAAETYAAGRYVAAVAYARTLFGLANAFTQQSFLAALTDSRAGERRATDYTASAAQMLSRQAQELFGDARARADAEFQIANDYARNLTLGAERHSDLNTAQTVAWTASIVGAVNLAVRAIERSPCMQRCETLGSLGGALEGLDLALIFGLYIAYRENPQGTTRFLNQTIAPGVRDLVAAAEGTIGL